MNAFVVCYRVLFSDTMAYGSHHHMTNFAFQNHAREHLFFRQIVEQSAEGAQAHDESIVLTQQAYSRNLAPVEVGKRVVVFMTLEGESRSSIRCCFRAIREDGTPVSTGFQTMVCIDKQTQALTAPPAFIRELAERIAETPTQTRSEVLDFEQQVYSGRTSAIFDDEICALAVQLAAQRDFPAEGTFVELSATQQVAAPAPEGPLQLAEGPVLLFGGQGSYDPQTVAFLMRQDAGRFALIRRLDAITESVLGHPIGPLLTAPTQASHDLLLARCPELAQLGMFLLGVWTAEELRKRGVAPGVLVGHSMGEIGALCAAGAMSVEDGALLVSHRARCLRDLGPGVGGMLAVFADAARVAELLTALQPLDAWTAVQNHDEQVVVAGQFDALERVEVYAASLGVSTRRLQSPHPFHTPLLAGAVAPFESALNGIAFSAPEFDVYSPLGRRLYPAGVVIDGLSAALASHFITPLSFNTAVRALYEAGARDWVECGSNSTITGFVRRGLVVSDLNLVSPLPRDADRLESLDRAASALVSAPATPQVPIAIVATGCVLPGAHSPEALWELIHSDRTGIRDAGSDDADLRADFLKTGIPTSDKTYTLLGGFVGDVVPPADLPVSDEAWQQMTRAQRYLALSLWQCTSTMNVDAERTSVCVGSTADGTAERDQTLLGRGFRRVATELPGSDLDRETLLHDLSELFADGTDGQFDSARSVVDTLVGSAATLRLLDAACASSLYAVHRGIADLRDGRCDLALCGGIFAPGPANSCLFSQFGGLSATGSHPFDLNADGVVFGDGAAVVALRRLPDALERGETVLALVHQVGTSSDGVGPSVALPSSAGQALAIRRAWKRAGENLLSAAFVEAHATATQVGDAVEFAAIAETFGGGRKKHLGSLKAVTGHTGWAAGAASIIKICQAFSHGSIPAQPGYEQPNAKIDLAGRFSISGSASAWPDDASLAAVNGFGFGGSNAHVILERYTPGAVIAEVTPATTPARRLLAVLGTDVRLPVGEAFGNAELKMPPGPLVLPDVQDAMDRSQVLATAAAFGALNSAQGELGGWRDTTGVFLGHEGKTQLSVLTNQRLYADQLRRVLRASPLTDALLASIDELPASGPYTLPGSMPNVAAGRVANHLRLRGPNLVVDAGRGSLFAALEQAEQNLRRGDCEIAIAGAVCGTSLPEFDRGMPLQEGAVALATCTPDFAREHGLPVIAVIELHDSYDTPPTLAVDRRGATGMGPLADALERADAEGTVTVALHGGTVMVHGPLALTPIHLADVRLVPAPLDSGQTVPNTRQSVLVLVDSAVDADLLGTALPGAQLIVIDVGDIDLADEQSASVALDDAGLAQVDGIIAIASGEVDDLMGEAEQNLTELLFLCIKNRLTSVASGQTRIGAVCLNGLDSQGRPSAQSGLLGGLLKSVQRELPDASCRSIITDGDVPAAIGALTREWGTDGPVEVALRQGRRQRFALVNVPVASHPGQTQVHADSVVIATGGARGVTAVLMEALQRKHACKIALFGRSDIGAVPAELVAMDDESFDAYEPEFYRAKSADGRRLADVRSEFATLRSRREAARTVQRLAELPGELIYVPCDITDAHAVRAAVAQVATQLGAPTLLVHGAGLQVSGALEKRSLDTFHRVVRTKIGGLANLLAATDDQPTPPAVHVLTSVFSFLGNDGQPDYGAANEGMNRLVERKRSTDRHWSALAWLGWAAVGMTRGSEYAALASARGLRPVTKEEGSQIFMDAVAGPRASGPQVITAGELAWSGEPLLPSDTPVMGLCWPLTETFLPLVDRHLVGGIPTLPGTFGMDLALQAGRAFRPGWQLSQVTDLTWARFVRLRDGLLRSEIREVHRDSNSCVLHVRLLSDFVHDSGVVLDSDIEHFSVQLHLRPEPLPMPSATTSPLGELRDTPPDPYHQAGSPVTLLEPFDPVERIQLFEQGRTGVFTPTERVSAIAHFESPAVVMDAICRFSMVTRTDESMPVFVPIHCGWFRFAPGVNDASLVGIALELRASEPVVDGEHVRCAQAEVVHPNGDVLLVARELLALRVGHVQAISNDGSPS